MSGRDFLVLAQRWANAPTEAEWRSAVSRAYYAAFHVGRELLESLGFRVPQADAAHKHLSFRLGNSSDAKVELAGRDMDLLRRHRNVADYDLQTPMPQTRAQRAIQTAGQIIQSLDGAVLEPTRTQVAEAMKIYERDVLQNVTWHP